MNVIPALNGPVRLSGGARPIDLPLTYRGSCPFAGLFPLAPAEDGVLLFETDLSLPAEGYRLTVEPEGIVLAGRDRSGTFYGLQTLFRMGEDGGVPCGVYEDAPRYRHRGFMLDVSRHFFSPEEIKKVIDQCAGMKLNVLHWHLSDDQGFRIESKKFPRLNEVGSWRIDPDGSRYGGYYTQAEILEIVRYAGERCITVIPEIDLPGHTTAIVSAYPELSCSGEPAEVGNHPGIYQRILCAGNEKVYLFLEELLAEVCGLFPGGIWFHIGGDEAPKAEWEKCPKCQAEMKKHGLQNEEELQALFTQRLAEMLRRQGRAVIGWNEILASGKMDPCAAAQYWTDLGAEYSAEEVKKGRNFIFSNSNTVYFCWDHRMYHLKGVYEFEPHIPGCEDIPRDQIMGVESALWTEFVFTEEDLERTTFPRLAAMAENAWTVQRDYPSFLLRLKAQEKRWQRDGVAFLPIEEADVRDLAVVAEGVISQLQQWAGNCPREEAEANAASYTIESLASVLPASFTREELAELLRIFKEKTA